MNRRVLLLIIGSLLLPLGCGGPTGLEPSEFCSDHSDAAIATFEDANLEAASRGALSLVDAQELTCGLVSGLTRLGARFAGITSLVGIQNLTDLTLLYLGFDSISDIGALSGLTSLTFLGLYSNSISDISALSRLTSLRGIEIARNSITDIGPLSGLTSLTFLGLYNNSISDISALSGLTSLTDLSLRYTSITNIQSLLDNTGLGAGDTVYLQSTNVSCTDVAALQAKGVTVQSDCP